MKRFLALLISFLFIPHLPCAKLETRRVQAEQTADIDEIWQVDDVDVSYVSHEKKYIAFTFDDGPTKRFENLLSVFIRFNEENPDCKGTATLFCNGYFFDNDSKHALMQAHALGWELGNHTFSHLDLTKISTAEIAVEMEKVDRYLQKIDGKPTHLFRPPFGQMDERIARLCKAPVINWSIDTLDWTGKDAHNVARHILDKAFPGAIVLMHDGYDNTVEALKIVLPKLRDGGFQVVSVSTLAKMHNCTFKKGKVYVRARKNR